MRPRAFLGVFATLITVVAATPQVALSQADAQTHRVAFAIVGMPLEELAVWEGYVAFREGLREQGYTEGENLIIDLWSGAGRVDRVEYAREIVASQPDVIAVASGCTLGVSLMQLTETIPIVFNSSDPIRCGLVSNLARPGGNVTGHTQSPGREFEGKWLQLLLEAAPSATRVGYLAPQRKWALVESDVANAATALGITIVPYLLEPPIDEQDYRHAFTAMAKDRVDVVLAGIASENNAHLELIAQLALETGLPATAQNNFAQLGGLLSYGPVIAERYAGIARYVARILKGEKPGDLPVQQPTEFELVVNLRTAHALGIEIPPILMIQAAELIE